MANAPRLNAVFYVTSSGNEPVREWLKCMPKQDRRAIGEDITYVQYKWPIGKPRVDHLRGAIWEVRTTLGNRYRNVSVRCSLWTMARCCSCMAL